jgi:hypothetical protein
MLTEELPFRPITVRQTCLIHKFNFLIAFPAERDPETSYEQGWKTYGFAAPFSKQGIAAVGKTTAVA